MFQSALNLLFDLQYEIEKIDQPLHIVGYLKLGSTISYTLLQIYLYLTVSL